VDQIVMPQYAPLFIGGLALYLVYRFGSNLVLWSIVGVSWALSQWQQVHALWDPTNTAVFYMRNPLMIVAVVTAGYIAVAVVALGWLDRVDWRWLTVAGAITYPFYLIHEHLGWVAINVLHKRLGVPATATFAITVAIMLLLGWLIHRFVERPLGPRLKRALLRPAIRSREEPPTMDEKKAAAATAAARRQGAG
jgi:peptidoglycan/LPS O-acetylase OafA/YrhL